MTERTTMWISFFCILVYVCVVVVVAVSFLFWGVCAGVCTFDCEQFDNDSSGGGHIYPSASVVFRLVSISFPHRLVVLWHSSSSAVECSHWKEVRIDGASILCVLFRAKTVSIPSGFIFCLFHSKNHNFSTTSETCTLCQHNLSLVLFYSDIHSDMYEVHVFLK